MAGHALSVVIRRPVADVFDYMNDVSREHEWQPHLVEAAQEPPGRSAVGTLRRYRSRFMGRPVENTWVIRAWEPGRRLVMETTVDSALEATSEVLWDAVPEGTRVTMSVEGKPKGAFRFVPPKLLEATMRKETDAALARLKERLER